MTDNPTLKGDATAWQVAEYLHHHPDTIRIMARCGEFPNAYKAGTGSRNSPARIPWSGVEKGRKKQPRVNS
ncbi:hypothetical protein AB4Y87_23425 [Paenarthrobacter sp. RAF54_2]|uniref:hypothetical protein n=1 Tax=Paenarthrobacter sp. RAF54_2 TaxID=3233061 RepID=UPI003F97E85B